MSDYLVLILTEFIQVAVERIVERHPDFMGADIAVNDFADGSLVKEGDRLYTIDAREYRAQVANVYGKRALKTARDRARG